MDIIINIAVFLIAAVIFTFVGIFIRKKIAESKLKSAENEAKKILDMAKIEAENRKKEEQALGVERKSKIESNRNGLTWYLSFKQPYDKCISENFVLNII